jgi:YidC/Oxa1 family membrane protein insertase
MFTTLIVQPIFNLLVLIYALLPGHNFGVAIIIFTIIIRLLLWPLVRKQLHQARLMRKIQPELKRIAKEAAGDKQKQSMLQMELYKEKGINPFGTIGIALLQLPILIGLYSGLQKVIHDPQQIVSFAYPALQHLPWMEHLAKNIHEFDATFLHVVDLTQPAFGGKYGFYLPAFIIVLASAVTQYYQAKQLMPDSKDARKLRVILKEAGQGKQADQQEVNAAISRGTRYFLPVMIFIFTINIPSALGLYWFVSGLIALIQQSIVLRKDEEEMEDLAGKAIRRDTSRIPEAEVIESATSETDSPNPVQTAPELNRSKKPIMAGSTVTSITRGKRGKK